jgi:hypothetical protein
MNDSHSRRSAFSWVHDGPFTGERSAATACRVRQIAYTGTYFIRENVAV